MRAIHTRSQERILNLLQNLKQGISAQDIYVELRNLKQSMGLATVYRSLDALKLEGLVQVRTLANGEALYSLIQQDKHHLTCLQCGISIPIHQCPVHELENQLQTSHQFKVFYHTLEFFGLCAKCRVKESGVRSQESGVRSQESGVRSQESGVRSSGVQESERRNEE